MGFDASALSRLQNFSDYQRADQEFQLKKLAATQQLQTGSVDAISKTAMLGAQLQAQGAATGDQASYDAAKQKAAALGIDSSGWAADPVTGAKQAQTTIQSFSPLGSLLNAGLKAEGNLGTSTSAMGSTAAGAQAAPLSAAIVNRLSPMLGGGQPVNPAQITPIQARMIPANGMTPAGTPDNAAPPVSAQAMNLQSPQGVEPLSGGDINTIVNAASAPARFSPPAQQQGETIAAYNARVQQAFEAYKTDPNFVASQEQIKAKAAALGKEQGEARKDAVNSAADYGQVQQTIQGIKDLANSDVGLPEDRFMIPASGYAAASQNFGNQKIADNYNAFNKLNEAQTIGAIRELANTGQIKMTRTLENILNRGYLVEPGASKTSKVQQADVVLKELENSKIAAQNVDAQLNGGQTQKFVAPLKSPPPAGATLYGTSSGKAVYKMPDGSFIMEQ